MVRISQNSVDITTTYGPDGPGFESRQGQQIFLFSKTFRPALGPTQPPIKWIPGFFAGVKHLGYEVDRSPPFSAEVKNEWSYISTPHICLHGMERDNFNFDGFCHEARNLNISVFNQTQA
jgi:hypothetical protein